MDTLEKKRQDQDLVTTYKILKGVDDVAKEVWFRQVPEDRTGPTEQEPQKGNTTVSG